MTSKKIQLICKLCKNPFMVFPSTIKYSNPKFCSKTCKDKMHSIEGRTEKMCTICNNTYSTIKNRKNIRKYCSHACANKARRLGAYDLSFLDTENDFNSWFLGWIMADGNITKRGSLSLGIIDKEIIDIICDRTKFKNKINKTNETNKKICNKFCKCKEVYKIQFGQGCADKLRKLGFKLGPKTGKEFIPNIVSDKTFFHFFRGMVEGDGTLYVNSKKRLSLRLFCSSEQFLNSILNRIKSNIQIHGGSVYKGPNIHVLGLGHADAIKVAGAMYKNSENMRLTRKHKKYLETKDTRLTNVPQLGVCSVALCDRKPIAKNLCGMHYLRSKNIKNCMLATG